jgi:hypothetical protein
MIPSEPESTPIDHGIRALVDDLERVPAEQRGTRLRDLAPALTRGWTMALETEHGLRGIVADLFLLGTVEVGESVRLARTLDLRPLPDDSSESSASGRRHRLAQALRDVLEAAVWLGASQRALEEARAALICRVPRVAFGCVDAEGDPALAELGALVMHAREGALGLGEALHLLAPALRGTDCFTRERALAACAAAHHFALHSARDIVFGSIRLAGPAGIAGDTALSRLSRDVVAMLAADRTMCAAEAAVAREFMRKAL